MENELEKRIRLAVKKGREVRSRYYAAIELPDEQELGSPALESQIIQLENRLQKQLPPSYRTFLKLFNGWRMINGSTDLLSVDEILYGPIAESCREWQMESRQWGDVVAARSLVIGVSNYTPTKILLDPERSDTKGEWSFIQHHKDEEVIYTNFLAWLEESIDGYEELIREENG